MPCIAVIEKYVSKFDICVRTFCGFSMKFDLLENNLLIKILLDTQPGALIVLHSGSTASNFSALSFCVVLDLSRYSCAALVGLIKNDKVLPPKKNGSAGMNTNKSKYGGNICMAWSELCCLGSLLSTI